MKKVAFLLVLFMAALGIVAAVADAVLPADLIEIQEEAFMGDGSLINIIIPDHVTTIGTRAFKDSGLTSIMIPEGVTRIGDEAFAITPMTSVTIPGSVTSIGDNALDADITVTAPAGSFAFQYCLDHSIALTYVNPDAVSLTERGQVTIKIADPREQTVMLGVYHRAAAASRTYPIFLVSGGVSDSPDAGTLKAVIPVTVEAGSASVTTDVSGLMQDSGSYYVRAKTVPSISAAGARDMTGPATISNRISYTRPNRALEKPTDVQWSSTVYGRAIWGKVAGAVSYQVTLYNQEGIVAHRNVNTNHFTFSSGWLDLDHITENGYTFTVTALSEDIFTVSNSPESDASAVLGEPASTELSIITQPASRYASLGEPYSVSISAMGVGITYDWYQVVPEGNILLAGRSDDNVITLTADMVGYAEIYAVLTDAYGNILPSEHANIHVIDDSRMDHMISTQPADFTVIEEEEHVFTVGADLSRLPYGDDCKVSYQWYKGREGEAFTAVPNYNKSEYKVYTHNITSGFQTYCVVTVTAPTGKVIAVEQSETATLIINRPVIYFRKNLNYSYYNARSQSIHVEVAVRPDATLLRYRWVYYTGSEYENWHEWQGTNTSYFPAYALTDEYEGAVLKCYADARYNGDIHTIESGEAHIHLGSNPATGIGIDANIDKANLTLYDSFRADFVLTPQDSTSSVYWFSTDQTVATVSDRGQVSIHGLGTAKIIGCTSPDVTIENGQVVQATGVWDEMPLTVNRVIVTFDPRGGRFADGETEPVKWKRYVGEQITLPGLSKDGDTFLGWSLNGGSLGGGAITGYTVGEQCVLMTAMWEDTTQEEDKELEIEQDLADNQPVSIGATALFEVVTNGAKVISYQWYENTGEGWTPINGGSMAGNKTSLNVECSEETIGNQYKVIITGANGIVRESNVCRLVNADTYDPDQPDPFEDPAGPVEEVHFTMQPENTMVQAGEPAEFYVGVDAPAEYQWQMLTEPDSSTWSDLSGETGTVLSIPNTTGDMAGHRYRCIVTAGGQELISNEAELDVLVIQIAPDGDVSKLAAGEAAGFTLSCNHSELIANNVQWSSTDSEVASIDENATGNTVAVQIHGTGTTTITATVEGFTATYELTVHHVTVTLDGNGGAFGEAETLQVKARAGEAYTPTQTPVREGYDFRGWSTTPDGEAAEEIIVQEPMELYAVWRKAEVHATGVEIEKVDGPDDPVPGDQITLRAILTPENSTDSVEWGGGEWDVLTVDDNGVVTIHGIGEGDVKATANADAYTYYDIRIHHVMLTLNGNGGMLETAEEMNEETSVKIDTDIDYDPTETFGVIPVRDGYNFIGWSLQENGSAMDSLAFTGNTTLYAVWQRKVNISIKCETDLSLLVPGDTIILEADFEPEETEDQSFIEVWSSSNPAVATVEKEETEISSHFGEVTIHSTGDVTIYAAIGGENEEVAPAQAEYSIQINHVMVTLNSNPDALNLPEDHPLRINQNYSERVTLGEYTLQAAAFEGYTFLGYCILTDEGPVGEPAMSFTITEPVVLQAQWERTPVEATSVTIKSPEGNWYAGDAVFLHATITPENHESEVNWSISDETFATIAEDVEASNTERYCLITFHKIGRATITVTAGNISDTIEVIITEARVTLHGNGGTFDGDAEVLPVTAGGQYAPEQVPTREGYTFLGWSLREDGEPVSEINVTEPVELYAIWSAQAETPTLIITGTDGNVTRNQRLVLTPQLFGADGEPISNATYTWYDTIPVEDNKITSDTPYWIDLMEGQMSFVVFGDATLVCVGTSGDVTAEGSITLNAAEDTNMISVRLQPDTQDVLLADATTAPATITCQHDSSEEVTYRWEYYMDGWPWKEYPWEVVPGPYEKDSELSVELESTGVYELIYQFRCTVEIERNGIHFEYVSDSGMVHVFYDETNDECLCGCGIPGCMCGPECPMMNEECSCGCGMPGCTCGPECPNMNGSGGDDPWIPEDDYMP